MPNTFQINWLINQPQILDRCLPFVVITPFPPRLPMRPHANASMQLACIATATLLAVVFFGGQMLVSSDLSSAGLRVFGLRLLGLHNSTQNIFDGQAVFEAEVSFRVPCFSCHIDLCVSLLTCFSLRCKCQVCKDVHTNTIQLFLHARNVHLDQVRWYDFSRWLWVVCRCPPNINPQK